MGDEHELKPRLCTIRKWDDFPGYGFNLHAERGRAGQYIGKVDDGSPAQAAGMKEGDRIVEVNGTNIGNENHSQVVTRIKAAGEEVTMLLVDAETDKYYKENKIVVSSEMAEVVQLETPPRPAADDEQEPEAPEVPDSEPPVEPPSYNDVQDDDRDADDDRPSSEPDHEPEITPAVDVSSHGYHPRLCVIRKWPDFQGYGFNLHAEKDKPGQYIGLVDANSPAEDADLRKGDRIIEVNGENIEESTHQQVIQKIKAGGDETTMLVVDSDADEYYKNNGIRISSSLPEVIKNETTPREAPAMTGHSFTPRLCHITKWPDFQGYGFNLHAEKERGGQYIGKIDDNSPAQDGGLRENDRIIEVNGVNVESETHGQVISRIKAGGDETKLLVVDREADSYYKSKGITVTSSMPEVKSLATTKRTPRTAVVTNGESSQTASISTPKRTQSKRHAPSPPSSPISPDEMFSMSAAEMRSHIQRHHSDKRVDRHSTHNIRDKVRLFQQL